MLSPTKHSKRSHDCLDDLRFDRLMLSPLPNQPGMVRSENKLLVLMLTHDSSELIATVAELWRSSDASSFQPSAELHELRDWGVKHKLLFEKPPVKSEFDDSTFIGQLLRQLFSVRSSTASIDCSSDALLAWLITTPPGHLLANAFWELTAGWSVCTTVELMEDCGILDGGRQ